MKEGRREGANERRRLGLLNSFGNQGESTKGKLSQRTERNSTLDTGLRTSTETADDMEEDEVIFEREKGPKGKPPPPPQYCSRWMRRQQTATMGTSPANLVMKMEGLNLAQKRETELQQEILRGSLRQDRLKKQLEEYSRKRCQ
jgi:hypothetical protein